MSHRSPDCTVSLCRFWCAALLGAVACQGGQTGDGDPIAEPASSENGVDLGNDNRELDGSDENGNGSTTNGEGSGRADDDSTTARCQYQRSPVPDRNDRSALGFSAQDILELSPIPIGTSLLWQGSARLSFGPEIGQSELRLNLYHLGGEVLLRQSSVDDCRPALEIDVMMNIISAGGALNETFLTTLVAETANYARFSHSIPAENLEGSFRVLATQPTGGVLDELQFKGILSAEGSCGSVRAVLKYTAVQSDLPPNPQLFGRGTVASWPGNEDCELLNSTNLQ